MSGSSPKPFPYHHQSLSSLPSLSLSQLEKNYFALKSKKKLHQYPLYYPLNQSNHSILVKSPFYDNNNCTNPKATCKCQFHKKQSIINSKTFTFLKKSPPNKQFHLQRLKTLQNSSPQNHKQSYHKRGISFLNQKQVNIKQKDEKLKRLIENNRQKYDEFLKIIKEQIGAQVDCYNYKFEQFLKSNKNWVLCEIKHNKSRKKKSNKQDYYHSVKKDNNERLKRDNNKSLKRDDNDQYLKKKYRGSLNRQYEQGHLSGNELSCIQQTKIGDDLREQSDRNDQQNKRPHYRYRTLGYDSFSEDDSQTQSDNQTKTINRKSTKQPFKSPIKKIKKSTQHNKLTPHSLHNQSNPNQHQSPNINKLKQKDKISLNKFYQTSFNQLGLNYSYPKSQYVQNPNFFSNLSINLIKADKQANEQAKKVLRRISKLPLNIYSTVMKQIKHQIQNIHLNPPNTIQIQPQEIQRSFIMAFDTIQEYIEENIKEKGDSKGKQKIKILSKIKNRLLPKYSQNLKRLSYTNKNNRNSIDSRLSFLSNQIETKKSHFAKQKQQLTNSSQIIQQNNQQSLQDKQQQKQQQEDQQTPQEGLKFQDLILRQKQIELKNANKMEKAKKMRKNKNLIQMIDKQIIQQHNLSNIAHPPKTKKVNHQHDTQVQNNHILTDQQYRRHLQYLQQINSRSNLNQNQNQSFTVNDYQIKRNSVQAHYIRHKKFINKMETFLFANQNLKDMVINIEENLLTKKRKVRILNDMIDQLILSQPNSQFYKDFKKYVEIFQKSCNLASKKNKDKKYKKLGKKIVSNDQLYEEDFRSEQKVLDRFNFDEFIRSIKIANQLKFYKVDFINLQEKDIESVIKESSTLSKPDSKCKKEELTKNKKENMFPKLMKMNQKEELLIQVGLDNKTQKVKMIEFKSSQPEMNDIKRDGNLEEDCEVRKLKQRFNRKMQKYQKILKVKTCPSQS